MKLESLGFLLVVVGLALVVYDLMSGNSWLNGSFWSLGLAGTVVAVVGILLIVIPYASASAKHPLSGSHQSFNLVGA